MNVNKLYLFNKKVIKDILMNEMIHKDECDKILSILDMIMNYDSSYFSNNLLTNNYDKRSIVSLIKKMLNLSLTISCVLIIRDEEKNIKSCLKSIANCFDEIIVVDTGSLDNTIDIICKMKLKNIKLFNYNWNNNFSDARNFGISKTSCDSIFFLDADERLQNVNYEQLHDILKLFYFFPEKDKLVLSPIIKDSYTNQQYINVHRIFFRNNSLYFYGKVHEEIRSKAGNIINICVKINILHEGYSLENMLDKNKIQRNLTLMAEQLREEPQNFRWIYMYVRDGLQVLDPIYLENVIKDNILINKNKTLDIDNIKDNKYLFGILTCLCLIYQKQGKMKEIRNITKIMNILVPENSNSIFFNIMSEYLILKNSLQKLIKECLKYRKNHFETQIGMLSDEGYHIDFLIAILLFDLYDFEKADMYFSYLEGKFNNNEFGLYIKQYRELLKSKTGG